VVGEELRGFAPIGVLEQWSAGMMGELVLNKMKETNRKTILSAFTAHCSGTPTLHHSM